FGLSGLADPEAALTQLQIQGVSLDPQQILALERLISVGMGLRLSLGDVKTRASFPELHALASQLPDLRRLLGSMRGKILPTGEIADSASLELRRIRRELGAGRGRIQRALESVLREQARAVQEDIITVRNGRFVIPVRTEARRQVSGVMHGLSSSGQTIYLEPLAVIDQNNELVRLREEEEIEIARILLEISESLRASLPELRDVSEALAEIDFAQAKARLSRDFQCARPQIQEEPRLQLLDARHLLLQDALRQAAGTVIPVSLELDPAHQVMVISGPNAGGKTVVLKTVGLITLMAQMGLHVPARAAVLPVFDQVFADIGDQQSISANLSTFTAHMRNISEMTQRIAPPALILIDEVGTGTDPHEGAALAIAIVDYFRRLGATTIATTHYNELKMWTSEQEDVLNASVEFDEQTLRPTYRLLVGIAGASAGLEIARRMDLPPEILDAAIGLVDPAQVQASEYLKQLKASVSEQESLVAALEEERKATAEKYARLDSEFARRQQEQRARFETELA
ncbi:MAG: endonuclease MutS2, partial [Gammaproteobacteria bacterium]